MNIDQIRSILEKQGDVAIALSSDYNLDEMASALGLYLVLRNNGRNVQVVTAKQPLVEVSNLVGIDKVVTAYQGRSGDLVVSFPYREGEIEKISYTMDNGLLNIVVKAGEQGLSFAENSVKFQRSGQAPAVLITIGIRDLSELGGVVDANGSSIINIAGGGFGDVLFASADSSSISEQVADLLYALGFRLDIDSSQNLLSGIISATNNFQNPNTSGLALEMGGILIRNGAQRKNPNPNQNQNQPQNFPQRQQNLGQNPVQPISGQTQTKTPPDDWLAPKIFKGSTNLG